MLPVDLSHVQFLREGNTDPSMLDTCMVLTEAFSRNELNERISTWPESELIPCGYNPNLQREVQKDGKTVGVSSGTIRLPLGTAVTELNRITITHRRGVPLTTWLTYGIAGVREGQTAIVVDLLQAIL